MFQWLLTLLLLLLHYFCFFCCFYDDDDYYYKYCYCYPESGVHSATATKAIRLVWGISEVSCLEIAYSPLITSFLESKIPTEPKEAVPLALYSVLRFERRFRANTNAAAFTFASPLTLTLAVTFYFHHQQQQYLDSPRDGCGVCGG